MRRALLAAAVAAVPSLAQAQVGYVEGAIGLALITDVSTKDYAITDPGVGTFVGHGELKFGSEFSFGAEVGLITQQRWRFGVSWDHATAELDEGTLVGTLNGSPYSETLSGDQIESLIGLSFDENVNIVAANGYYSFGEPVAAIRPYIGLGAGVALFQNAGSELAIQATAGLRVAVGPSAYIGGRYRFGWIQGPEDELGIEYDSISLHTLSLILGFYF